MPLMTLVCTALDQTTAAPEVAQANSLAYLPTDTICYWADPVEDRLLHRKQKEAWDSIHEHCATLFGERAAVALGANEGILLSRVQGRKSIGLPHPAKVVTGAQQFVKSLDAWHLTALSVVASEAKSLLLQPLCCREHLIPTKLQRRQELREEFQISIWGMVRGTRLRSTKLFYSNARSAYVDIINCNGQ
jgi:chaperone required for assembly of F1-ATPase